MKNVNKVFMVMVVIMAIFAFASCDNAADSSSSTVTLSAGDYYSDDAETVTLNSDGTVSIGGYQCGTWTQTSITIEEGDYSLVYKLEVTSSTSFTLSYEAEGLSATFVKQ